MQVFSSVVASKNALSAALIFLAFTLAPIFTPVIATAQDPAPATAAAPAAAAPAAAGNELADKGKGIFEQNCKNCHAINEQVVGPALRDANKRWPSEAAMMEFIKHPQKTIDGGNAYAKGLYTKYGVYMSNWDGLGDDNIKAVIAYIKAESAKPVETAKAAAATAGGGASSEGGAVDSTTLNLLIAGFILVLALIIIALLLLVSVINNSLASKQDLDADDKDFINQKTDWNAIFSGSIFKATIAIVFLLGLTKVAFDKTYAVGVNQGYAPTQPIPFSHKLHAGMYEIDCNYCHTGVNRGKYATIPSLNICMNCHNSIKTQSPSMQAMYKKIRANEPIQWVRVHNLPDLSYFNHSQHVKVGGIECETCHGPIKEMEVVEQHSTLTMGWCVNCHRETVVKADGNAYYDKLVQMHNTHTSDPLKVVNIGGLECSKCHY
ncbi:MAG: c-type cytochrome [Bacteroidota bacterium]